MQIYSTETTTGERKRKRTSKYAKKVQAGKQKYGNGKRCCAHRFAREVAMKLSLER